MGRPPSNGGPAFRFTPAEVTEMETILQEHYNTMPAREVLVALAEKFSNTPERQGKITVQMKQVWNWFQNKRYAIRAKLSKAPGKFNAAPTTQDGSTSMRNVPPVVGTPVASPLTAPTGKVASDMPLMEFEAKSARDGAWYDVSNFISHRHIDTGEPEVLVRFAGFGADEDEWINVCKHVRQRSLPCEASECVAVLPGDLILCFQEGKEQALYFDAHVLDAQRRRHDVRGCRCRFLVRYDHDESEEIVPLRKVCRRPETDYRLQQLHATTESAVTDQQKNGDLSKAAAPPPSSSPAEVLQKLQVSDGPAAPPVAPANVPSTPGTTNSERKPAEVSITVDAGTSNATAGAALITSGPIPSVAAPSSSSATTSVAPPSGGPTPTTAAPSSSDEQAKEEK